VQLATLAHIRHTYTDYDERLKRKGETRLHARLSIERKCLSLLLKWRGEDDEFEIEERQEEVVIIDDSDEESDEDLGIWDYSTDNRRGSPDSDVEILGFRDFSRTGRVKEHFRSALPDVFSPQIAGAIPQRRQARRSQTPRQAPLQSSWAGQGASSYSVPQQTPRVVPPVPMWNGSRELAQSNEPLQPPSHFVPDYMPGGWSSMFPSSSQNQQTDPQQPLSFGNTAWPMCVVLFPLYLAELTLFRPVTVLTASPAEVPETVCDKDGNIFLFNRVSISFVLWKPHLFTYLIVYTHDHSSGQSSACGS
jgi:hypothetical protein